MERRSFIKACAAGAATAGGSILLAGAGSQETKPGIDCEGLGDSAIKHFTQGNRACSESVLMAGCECLGVTSDVIPDIAFGLAGGIGMQGKTCGAVTGSAMVLSLAAARSKNPMMRMRAIEAVGRLYKNVEKKLGTADCRELTGIDLTTEEGRKAILGVKEAKCVPAVRVASEFLAEELSKFE